MTKLPTLVVMFSGLARSGRTTLMRGLIERYASQREIFDHARMRARLHVDGRAFSVVMWHVLAVPLSRRETVPELIRVLDDEQRLRAETDCAVAVVDMLKTSLRYVHYPLADVENRNALVVGTKPSHPHAAPQDVVEGLLGRRLDHRFDDDRVIEAIGVWLRGQAELRGRATEPPSVTAALERPRIVFRTIHVGGHAFSSGKRTLIRSVMRCSQSASMRDDTDFARADPRPQDLVWRENVTIRVYRGALQGSFAYDPLAPYDRWRPPDAITALYHPAFKACDASLIAVDLRKRHVEHNREEIRMTRAVAESLGFENGDMPFYFVGTFADDATALSETAEQLHGIELRASFGMSLGDTAYAEDAIRSLVHGILAELDPPP